MSRFKEDFIIEDTIGKGGGGVVFKVKNKYNGMLNAVKKVKINLNNMEKTKKLLKEVMVLSSF
jgi:translation initiation factor 2-alpha kinase 4